MVEHVVHVHLSVGAFSKSFQEKLRRVNHVTPKNYLDFINTYTRLLREKHKFVQDQVYVTTALHTHTSSSLSLSIAQCHRLDGGLRKLIEASDQIKVMSEKLEVQVALGAGQAL